MTETESRLYDFISKAAWQGRGRITVDQLWQIKLMDVDESILASVALQVQQELLGRAGETINDAFSDSFLDIVFGFRGLNDNFLSAVWDIHLLSIFDSYTLLARQLCDALSVQTGQPRPRSALSFPNRYDWLEQSHIHYILESGGKKWLYDIHGRHCLFVCREDDTRSMNGARIEATLDNIHHVDERFFLNYLLTCLEHAGMRVWFENNGLEHMRRLFSLYINKGWLVETASHEYERTSYSRPLFGSLATAHSEMP